MSPPKLSVCIPAYNRPEEIRSLLDSISGQDPAVDWDVVICEDKSPRGPEIEEVAASFARKHPGLRLRYYTNERNVGYDANLRLLLDRATGDYCLFMGDDDLLAPGALRTIAKALGHPGTGFVLRAWESIDKETGRRIEEYRYFPGDRIFLPGVDSVAAFYRRSVFISGLTVHREAARKHHTDRFDGSLLYQLYLAGKILAKWNGYYVSEVVAIRRLGGEHFFGSSETEKDRFTPKQLLPSQSVTFVKGLLDIARTLDGECLPGLFDRVRKDLGRYSYPLLEIQAGRLTRGEFRKYARSLAALGLGSSWAFRAYYSALLCLGPNVPNALIRSAKRLLGRTPNLGGGGGIAVTR